MVGARDTVCRYQHRHQTSTTHAEENPSESLCRGFFRITMGTRFVCARYVVACAGQENMAAMIGNKEANERCRGRGDDSFGIFLLSP